MDLPGIIPLHESGGRLPRMFLKLEGWLGAFWATVLTLGWAGFVGSVIDRIKPNKNGEIALWVIAVALWVLLEVPFLWRVWTSAIRGQVPLALHVAARQPLRPVPINLIICAWWLGHFVVGLFVAFQIESEFSHGSVTEAGSVITVVAVLVAVLCSIAANIYLAYAMAALTRGKLVETIWRFRWLFDIALSLFALAAVLQKRH